MSEETWKAVVGFEGSYEVSNLGRVRSLDRTYMQVSRKGTLHAHPMRGRLLRPGPMPGGHLSVAIGKGNSHCVHELVLRAFLGPPPDGCEARHLNGDEKDNRFENLVWDTRGNNTRDKRWHRGARTYKLSPADVAIIKTRLKQPYRGILTDLGDEFGVTNGAIYSIREGLTHIDVEAAS